MTIETCSSSAPDLAQNMCLRWTTRTGQRRGDAAGTTMALYDAGGRVLARLRNYLSSNGSRNKIMWQAATGGIITL